MTKPEPHWIGGILLLALFMAAGCGVLPGPSVSSSDSLRGGQSSERLDLEELLRTNPHTAGAVAQAATMRLQVLLSVPTLDGGLRREAFRGDAEYFYPASTIKLCVAVGALEVLNELRSKGATWLDPSALVVSDSSSHQAVGPASVATLVERMLVISDNDASNALFDLTGFDDLHERMWRVGLSSFRMNHRLGVPASDDVRSTPQVSLLARSRATVVVPPREGTLTLAPNDGPGIVVGESHLVAGRLVDEPMNFGGKNRVSLHDLQDLLIAIMRPDLRPGTDLRLSEGERDLLKEALATLPSGRGAPLVSDVGQKPLLAGIERVVPRTGLVVASKSGRAYGFVIDNAYVADRRTGRSFFLGVVVYANDNRRLNDDVYEYAAHAFPLLADIGETVARAVLGTRL